VDAWSESARHTRAARSGMIARSQVEAPVWPMLTGLYLLVAGGVRDDELAL